MKVKTARFADVVKQCGKPEPHLVLTDPAKDRDLQAAIKSKRVMTVFQDTVGAKADRAVVGFEPGAARQFLIFPSTLSDFAGRRIVGIKYDLWEEPEIPKSQRAKVAPPKAPRASRPAQKERKLPANVLMMPMAGADDQRGLKQKAKAQKREPKGRVKKERSAEDSAVDSIKKQVREAMRALEEGKQVAAFNLLKRIAEE